MAGAVHSAQPISLSHFDQLRPEIKIAFSWIDLHKISSLRIDIETRVVKIGRFSDSNALVYRTQRIHFLGSHLLSAAIR